MIPLRRIFSGSAARGADLMVQVLCTLWITPILIESLGRERYGLWVTVITLVSYLDIFDLGLTSAVTRYVSRALGRKDPAAAQETVRSSFTILLVIGLCCLALVALLAAAAPLLLKNSAQIAPVQTIIVILGAVAALSFPLRTFAGVLEAHARYELTSCASMLRAIFTTAALWWVLRSGGDLINVVAVVAAGGLLQRAVNYFFARRIFPAMQLLPLGSTAEARAELLGYGWKNFLLKLIDLVRFRADHLVIARFVGLAPVGVYAIGMSLVRYFRQFVDCLGGVFMPLFSHAEGTADRTQLRAQLSAAMRLCSCVAMLVGGGLVLYGELFIRWWLGPGFRDSYLVMVILVGPFIIAMAQSPGIYMLYGLSKQDRLLRLNVIEAIANLTLSIALVFRFGIFGVAAGTAISMLITKLLLQPTILCEEAAISRRLYYFNLLALPLALTAAAMLACHALLFTWLRPELLRLVAAGVAQVIAVSLVAWFFLAGENFRGTILRAIARRAA